MKQMTEQQRLCLQALSGLPAKSPVTIICLNSKSAIPLTATVLRTNLRVLAKEGYCTEEEGGGFTITPAGEAAVQAQAVESEPQPESADAGMSVSVGRKCTECACYAVCRLQFDHAELQAAILEAAEKAAEKVGVPFGVARITFDWSKQALTCTHYVEVPVDATVPAA